MIRQSCTTIPIPIGGTALVQLDLEPICSRVFLYPCVQHDIGHCYSRHFADELDSIAASLQRACMNEWRSYQAVISRAMSILQGVQHSMFLIGTWSNTRQTKQHQYDVDA